MKIGITLNEVIRDFAGKFQSTYNRYVASSEKEEIEGLLTSAELLDIEGIKFQNMEQLNNFMYIHAPLEIFGHADQLHEHVNAKVNEFLTDIEDDEEHEVTLICVEHGRSIPATLFFLSKTGLKFRNIKFVKKEKEIWENVDVLITANPRVLDMKPEEKKSIKIKYPYNHENESDFEYETIIDFIENKKILKEI